MWFSSRIASANKLQSEYFKHGAPQGSPVSPMVFNIFLEVDFEELIGSTESLVYADHCKRRKVVELIGAILSNIII